MAAAAIGAVTLAVRMVPRADVPSAEHADEPRASIAEVPVTPSAVPPNGPIRFRDVSSTTGIDFCHTDGSAGHRYIMETVASGVATFDYDGDGQIDIYFLSGCPLGDAKADSPPRNRLYRNLGQFRFADVTDTAGVGDTGFSLGVAVGDYDNDGRPDVYVSNFGPNMMYHNNGNGTFGEVSRQAGTAAADSHKVGAGAAFVDIDNDGKLDLFVANYLVFSYDKHVTNTLRGVPIYAGPERFPPIASMVFKNRGDGTFQDVSRESGVGLLLGKGMGMVCADYDDDGDTDVLVNNDGPPGNFLFQNDGKGKFTEVGVASGIAFSGSGLVNGSMGVDCGDYDNDGRVDFYLTAYQGQWASLYRNLGGGLFDDVTLRTGAGQRSRSQVTWGCGLVDLDNDGHKDIFFGCGHLIDNIDELDRTTSYLARPVVLRNTGQGTFEDVSDRAGDGLQVKAVARGVAFDDLDNDGRLDVVILSSRRPPIVLRNESPGGNHWLQIRLCGVRANRDGIGARVKVTAGDLVQVDERHGGRGYQSCFGSRLHFGLGKHDRADRIEVRWPGGGTDVLENVSADQQITIQQRAGPGPGDGDGK